MVFIQLRTELQLWRYLAKECELAATGGECGKIRGVDRGLCCTLTNLMNLGCIGLAIYGSACNRLYENRPRNKRLNIYWWGHNESGWKRRADFCRRMADQCKPKVKGVKNASDKSASKVA